MADSMTAVLSEGVVFLGRYEIVKRLGKGGMGAVYEVIDRKTRRRRALKVMLPTVENPDLRARFRLEATITASVESEHIVETLDADVDPETGGEVVFLLYQAALALDRTHEAAIVHRDLKPEHLFIARGDDGSPRLKIPRALRWMR